MNFSYALRIVRGVVNLPPEKHRICWTNKGQRRPWLSSTVRISMPGERKNVIVKQRNVFVIVYF